MGRVEKPSPFFISKKMATQRKEKRAPDAPKVKVINEGDATVNIGNTAKTNDTVTILFRSRSSQKFNLKNGKSLTINGNGVYLANTKGGALPAGGYGVTVVDRALWEQVKAELGKAYAPWFETGKIKEKKSESQGVNYAIDHADEKTGDDPMPKKEAPKE